MEQDEKRNLQDRKVTVIDEALQDLREIVEFIAVNKNQPLNAQNIENEVWETIERIGRTPFAFKEYEHAPTKGKMYRQANCLSWLIVYKITQSEIVVLEIVHVSTIRLSRRIP
jgi:plasmid stabilization system protein ParE